MGTPISVVLTRDIRGDPSGYEPGLKPLREHPDIELDFLSGPEGREITPEEVRGVDVLLTVVERITADSFAEVDDLALVGQLSAGYDMIDLEACTDRGIAVVHAPGGPTESVAQATVGALIACANRLKKRDRLVRKQSFEDRWAYPGRELGEQRLGLIGLGDIGQRVAELIEPFELDILGHDPYADADRLDELGIVRTDLDDLIARADYVSLHVPLTEETAGMLDSDSFRRMQESAYLVNLARGGIYRDADLARALREGWIRGAFVDVYENEPEVADNPLLKLPPDTELLLSQHNAAMTTDTLHRIARMVSQSVLEFAAGDIPSNLLNPDSFDRPVPAEKRSPAY